MADISDELIHEPNQTAFLRSKLKEVNQQLPASVYLPFVSDSMRNYVVLNIVIDEARIFKTKERAPTMLCIECYRPVELSLEKVPKLIKNEVPEQIMTSSSAENPVVKKEGLAPIRTSSDVQSAEDEVDFNLLVTSTRNKSMSFNMSRAGANDGLFPFATDLHA